jgi:hypothetical protein
MRPVATHNPDLQARRLDIAESQSAGSELSSRPPTTRKNAEIGSAEGRELSSLALLRKSDEISLAAQEAEVVRICVPGGEILFRENDLADALYIVIAGCLAVTVRSSNGRNMMVARIRAGDIVGELGRMSDRSMIEQQRPVAVVQEFADKIVSNAVAICLQAERHDGNGPQLRQSRDNRA